MSRSVWLHSWIMTYALTIYGCNIGLAAKIGVAAKTVIPRSENKNSQIAHVVKRASNKISNQLIFLRGTSMMNYFHVASWYCWLTTWHFTTFCHWKWTKTTTQIIRAFYSEFTFMWPDDIVDWLHGTLLLFVTENGPKWHHKFSVKLACKTKEI